MKSIRPIHLALALSLGLAAACDVVPDEPVMSKGATLKISGVAKTAPGIWKVDYTTTNLTLADPGTCGGNAGCGHIQIFVDGLACNQGTAKYYAATANPTTFDVDINKCPKGAAGEHLIALELVRNDGKTPVYNSFNNVVGDSRKVKEESP